MPGGWLTLRNGAQSPNPTPYTLSTIPCPAQGALALLGTQGPDTAGAPAARSSAAARRYGPGARRALSGRVAALEPYIQERCVGSSVTFVEEQLNVKIMVFCSSNRLGWLALVGSCFAVQRPRVELSISLNL